MFQPGTLPTKVVCLTQVVSPDELGDDDEYVDILEDMKTEGSKYGTLILHIFRLLLSLPVI